jgi:hypothetical protein
VLDLEDDYDVLAQQFYTICETQDAVAGFPASLRAELEQVAIEAGDSVIDPLPETQGPTKFSKRWRRAPDSVFAEYAPLDQRRPAQ